MLLFGVGGGAECIGDNYHPPSPSKFTPVCLDGLVQYMSLTADPRPLLC